MSTRTLIGSCLLLVALAMTSCRKDEPEAPVVPNEEELITTVNYTLTPTGGGTEVVLTFEDLDGDGGDAPVITSGILSSNTEYSGVIQLLNELEDPAEDITQEVEEEDEEHQFFYSSDISGVVVTYDDADGNGNPIGIATTLTTGDPGTGTLTIVLRHEPDKDAMGVSSGDITNAGGETDIEVDFDIEVQ